MQNFTFADLKRILNSCAGVDEVVDLGGPVLDTEFVELGYDSLALLELASRVQREYGVAMPDEASQQMITPRGAISYVNAVLGAVAALPVAKVV